MSKGRWIWTHLRHSILNNMPRPMTEKERNGQLMQVQVLWRHKAMKSALRNSRETWKTAITSLKWPKAHQETSRRLWMTFNMNSKFIQLLFTIKWSTTQERESIKLASKITKSTGHTSQRISNQVKFHSKNSQFQNIQLLNQWSKHSRRYLSRWIIKKAGS